jgi:type IV pilus assembly protein PilF
LQPDCVDESSKNEDILGESIMKKRESIISRGLVLLAAVLFCYACAGQNVRENQRQADSKRSIGEAYMRQGDYTSALRELTEAEKLDPDNAFTQHDLGLCFREKHRMGEALAHLNKAVSLKPSYTPARNSLGRVYLEMGQIDKAIAIFKEIAKDALYATPHFPLANLGLAYYKKGDYPTALEYYHKALKMEPNFVFALHGVGATYLAMKKGRLALDYLGRALKLAPKVAQIHFEYAEANLLVGNTAQARISYENAIDLASPESEVAAKARLRLSSLK